MKMGTHMVAVALVWGMAQTALAEEKPTSAPDVAAYLQAIQAFGVEPGTTHRGPGMS